MRLSARRALQGLNDHLLDLGIAYLAGRTGSRFVIKPSLYYYVKYPLHLSLKKHSMGAWSPYPGMSNFGKKV
jgi:hypothetical protein